MRSRRVYQVTKTCNKRYPRVRGVPPSLFVVNRVCYTFDCSLIGSLVGIISQHSLQRACLVTIVAQWQTPVEWERLLRSDDCCGRAVGTDASLERTHHCCILSPVVFSCGVPERRVCSTRRVRGRLHVAGTASVASVAGVGATVLTTGDTRRRILRGWRHLWQPV